jgi:GDP-mannose pyrophosphatase NudK
MKAIILDKEILSNKWGEYARYKIEYETSDGRKQEQLREIQDNGNGAAVLLYNLDKREVLLIKQFRLASMLNGNKSGIIIEVCAGLVENDNPEKTIIKEIKEEVGYIVDKVDYHFKGYATPGAKTEMIYFFTAPYDNNTLKVKGGGLLEEQEDIEVLYYDFDLAYDMIFTGEIIDNKTITLLLYAKINIFN